MLRQQPTAKEKGQVALVQANDTVRAVCSASPAPSTFSIASSSSFAPSTTMSKQSVRVVARPPPPQTLPHSLPVPPGMMPPHRQLRPPSALPSTSFNNHGGARSQMHLSLTPGQIQQRSDIAELAEQQRRQIEANRKEEERREQMLAVAGHELALRVRSLRREVAEEELELKRLSELERETRALRIRNAEASSDLEMLTRTVDQEQLQLRRAAAKVDALRAQLHELHRRRKAAASAALAEQRRMQNHNAHCAQMAARAQSEGPQPVTVSVPSGAWAAIGGSQEQQAAAAARPRASVEPFQVQMSKCVVDSKNGNGDQAKASEDSSPRSSLPLPPSGRPFHSADGAALSGLAKRADLSPSPPKDPQHARSGVSSDSTDAASASSVSLALPRFRGGRTDIVSLRCDSLKATKRRSWAASENTTLSESDVIRRILAEQIKGRSHFIPDFAPPSATPFSSSSEAENVTATKRADNENAEPAEAKGNIQDDCPENSSTSSEGVSHSDDEPAEVAPPLLIERPAALSSVNSHNIVHEDTSSIDEESSECSARGSEQLLLEVEPDKKSVRGILRKANSSSRGRIRFDPLALLLDAALEGEMDLVRASASELSDVSASNDEGITALHNAICAGHYEIVHFLIESFADVNAQDSDGWTPLHCAASCNNLPMVRILVEGGACVLASTLSDDETPVDKCESEEDGFVGCHRYLLTAHNATGTINDGIVYAAYGYTAEREDELSFEAGERLRVIEKDEGAGAEKGWWKCERERGGSPPLQALAPRTFLSLYPPLKYRNEIGFVPFDLETNNNEKEK